MRNKLGIFCMILGAALVMGALSLFLWNRQEETRAEESVNRILPLLFERLEETPSGSETGPSQETEPTYPDPYDPAMTEVEIDGYGYIGFLSIPALELELPVMSQWDYPRLKIAPCRYTGSTKTDDLVIAAHNYARHFGGLGKLTVGDQVYFTDMDGVVTRYEVAAVEILLPTAVEDMTAGDFDLTLFTCTYGGQNRVTVRCSRSEATE